MILLDGQLNGHPASFLFDTGANNSVMDYRAAGFPGPKGTAQRAFYSLPYFCDLNPFRFSCSLCRCIISRGLAAAHRRRVQASGHGEK